MTAGTAAPKITPTAEQAAALELFATGRSLAIEAGAGTGKTSTLKLLAESTTRRGQYIAFNRPIVEEAKTKFPSNVACNTAHSLAMRNFGRPFAHRLPTIRMNSTELAKRLAVEAITVTVDGTEKRLAPTFLAGLAMRAVERFCNSADPEPSERHVPYVEGIDIPPGARANNDRVARALVPTMRRIWADALDTRGSLPYKHAYYLKGWQLSGPRVNADFILFDEAQDANPVMVAIVAAQTHAQLVWVGDSQQQIYTFTGAVNALASVGAEQTAFLSQSFRFGPAVAEVANRLLDDLDAALRLRGLDSIESTVEPVADPDAYLTRTNAAAVARLLGAIADGRNPHLVGGGAEVIAFAKAARDLMTQGWTSHPELACFASWVEVQEYVEQDEQGGDLRLMVKLIDEFGVEAIIDALQRMPKREADADLVISTAHKSKGREWDTVQLGPDFPEEPKGEELRLLYVAVTRAKRTLDLTAVGYLASEREPVEVEPVEVVEVEVEVEVDVSEPGQVDDCDESVLAELDDEATPTPAPAPAAPETGSPGRRDDDPAVDSPVFRVIANGRDELATLPSARNACEVARALYMTGRYRRVTVLNGADLIMELDA